MSELSTSQKSTPSHSSTQASNQPSDQELNRYALFILLILILLVVVVSIVDHIIGEEQQSTLSCTEGIEATISVDDRNTVILILPDYAERVNVEWGNTLIYPVEADAELIPLTEPQISGGQPGDQVSYTFMSSGQHDIRVTPSVKYFIDSPEGSCQFSN